MAAAPVGAFTPPDVPDLDAIRKCVHCGICLPQCPTYRVLGEEMDSPRGRIYLMRAAAEGRARLTETFARHIELCLGCRACESACPSGVPFGSLLEATRAQLRQRDGGGRPAGVLERAVYALFPEADRVGLAMRGLDLYRRSGLQALVRGSGVLAPFPRLAAMDGLLDRVAGAPPLPAFIPAEGRRRGQVGLLTGCVQRHFFPRLNADAARLLALAGFDVVMPEAQGCCGALDLHAGRLEPFRERARRLAAIFDDDDLDFIVTSAAGCGSTMKEYGQWLGDVGAARRLAARTRDVAEVLATAELPLGRLEATVTYHDACHLAHGQRVRSQPRALLARIPGLTLIELRDSDVCCGSAGVYNVLHPEMAERLLEMKIARIAETGARIVAAGNPGCLMQIVKGARARLPDLEVVHPVELLARSVDAGRGV